MGKDKAVMKAESVQRKEFTYEMGGIRLNFTLRTDVKSELKAFREMMERAIGDLDEEIEKVGK